jgi:hypothetical protein
MGKRQASELQNAALLGNNAGSLVPRKVGNIPRLAVLLGLISPKYYELYEACDGATTIDGLAQKLHISPDEVKVSVDRLVRNKMMEI